MKYTNENGARWSTKKRSRNWYVYEWSDNARSSTFYSASLNIVFVHIIIVIIEARSRVGRSNEERWKKDDERKMGERETWERDELKLQKKRVY